MTEIGSSYIPRKVAHFDGNDLQQLGEIGGNERLPVFLGRNTI